MGGSAPSAERGLGWRALDARTAKAPGDLHLLRPALKVRQAPVPPGTALNYPEKRQLKTHAACLAPAMAAPAAMTPKISRSFAEPPAFIICLRDMAGGRGQKQNAR